MKHLTSKQKAAWIAKLRDPSTVQAFNIYGDATRSCAVGCLVQTLGGMMFLDTALRLLTRNERQQLEWMNDRAKLTLPQIADWVEEMIDTEYDNEQ
jgi:hypothetical protein